MRLEELRFLIVFVCLQFVETGHVTQYSSKKWESLTNDFTNGITQNSKSELPIRGRGNGSSNSNKGCLTVKATLSKSSGLSRPADPS